MTFGDSMAQAESVYIERVFDDTWGHLAPVKNKKYPIRIVWAVGCYESNSSTIIVSDCAVDDSPYLYEALNDFIFDIDRENNHLEGCVYEFLGSFKNYKFSGNVTMLYDFNGG